MDVATQIIQGSWRRGGDDREREGQSARGGGGLFQAHTSIQKESSRRRSAIQVKVVSFQLGRRVDSLSL